MTLLLPPVQYGPRRLLVPFAGSGSEGLGAMMAGWERVTLIEQSLDYCALAANRLAWWWPRVRQGMTEVKAVLNTWHKSDAEAQTDQVDELPLFAGISNPSFQTAIR
jgi:16S rRNA G966 N2-methylase RsmD